MNRIQLAALNNAEWCAAVWRSHGLRTEQSAGAWFTRNATPSLYPNIVTVDPDADHEQQLAIAIEVADELRTASVKDSYASLPLASFGYEELFAARWLWAEPGTLLLDGSATRCERITSSVGIADWISRWTQSGGAANNLIPNLTSDSRVEIWGKRGANGQLYGGLIAFRSTGVLGITNLFGSVSGLLAAVSGEGRETLCCYQHGRALSWAIDQGFEAIGPLTVWIYREG